MRKTLFAAAVCARACFHTLWKCSHLKNVHEEWVRRTQPFLIDSPRKYVLKWRQTVHSHWYKRVMPKQNTQTMRYDRTCPTSIAVIFSSFVFVSDTALSQTNSPTYLSYCITNSHRYVVNNWKKYELQNCSSRTYSAGCVKKKKKKSMCWCCFSLQFFFSMIRTLVVATVNN